MVEAAMLSDKTENVIEIANILGRPASFRDPIRILSGR